MSLLKRKLLFKIWIFPKISETFIVNQIIIAIKLGFDVSILVREICNEDIKSYQELFTRYDILDKIIIESIKLPASRLERVLDGCRILFRKPKIIWYCLKIYWLEGKVSLEYLFNLNFYSSFRNFDIIHVQYGTNKKPIDIFKRIGFLNSKFIVSFHGHDIHFPINGIIHNNNYYKNLFFSADYLICNTKYLREKLKYLGATDEKIETIPVGVDTSFFKRSSSRLRSKKLRLITVGRLDELKGQIYGIRTAERLIAKGFEIDYIIAGNGPMLPQLLEEVHRLKLSEHIFFTKEINCKGVQEILQTADIFLMTSVTNKSGMRESQGLVTAEAQACGLPVVAFDSGGIKYTLKDGVTGFLCREKDLACFTSKIEELIVDGSLRKRMGENAICFIEENFSENSVIEKWKKIYS